MNPQPTDAPQVQVDARDISIDIGEGVILALETVKLGPPDYAPGDIGFRGCVWYKDVVYMATKLMPCGMDKPKTLEQARGLLAHLFRYAPEHIYYYEPGKKIEYRL